MNFHPVLGLLGIIGTVLISWWAFVKPLLVCTYNLEPEASKRLLNKIIKDAKWKYVISSFYVKDPKVPHTFEAFVLLDGCFFYFSRTERLLTAGWKSKENVSQISYFRLFGKNAEQLLSSASDDKSIPVQVLAPGSCDKLGDLIPNQDAKVYIDKSQYVDIEDGVLQVISGKLNKLGFLLYGNPGTGKTQFVKYLAVKYSLPVYVVYLSPDYSNQDITMMFSEIPSKCIVLLEDFDTMFNKRECLMKNDTVRFTFDSLINSFDGVHNDYKGVIFAMTANDIDKIDDSLKKRPSRFKYVREFTKPSADIRRMILNDDESVEETEGMTLDEVFSYRDKWQGKNDSSKISLWLDPGGSVA
jgi:hypothetical protein